MLSVPRLASAVDRGDLLVAETEAGPVGFALLGVLGDDAHLCELDVVPEAAGRGIGRALIARSAELAAARGHGRLVLTTFRDVPFNAPFYARLGFREVGGDSAGPALDAILRAEAEAGFPADARCAMALGLDGAGAGHRDPGEEEHP